MKFNFDSVKDILRCPKCRSELIQDGDALVSTHPECRLRFTIFDGIPMMVVEEAVELSMEDWQTAMQRREAVV